MNSDRTITKIEKPVSCRYFQVMVNNMVVALCPSLETARLCLYAITFYEEHMRPVKELLRS